jgi:opacity protein-like surface antigen
MLRISKALALGGIFTLLGVAPAFAQYDEGARYRDQGVMVYGLAGGFTALSDLNALEDSFKTGFSLGGGVGYQINRHLAVRGNLDFSRAKADTPFTPPIDNQDYDRYFYGVDLQVRYPTRSGLAPYAVIGGGGVTIDPQIAGMDTFTKPAGKVGAGIGYHFRNSGTSVFAEWNGWVYDWDRNDVNRTQFDTTWSGGLRFTF